ncbi:hypothetical protein L9F63_003801, partial [Diploptera punctata]
YYLANSHALHLTSKYEPPLTSPEQVDTALTEACGKSGLMTDDNIRSSDIIDNMFIHVSAKPIANMFIQVRL